MIITGKDISVLMGSESFNSIYDLYKRKKDKIYEKDVYYEQLKDKKIKAGKKLEEIGVLYFQEEYDHKYLLKQNVANSEHKSEGNFYAYPDALLYDKQSKKLVGLLEIKASSLIGYELNADNIPLNFIYQLNWDLGIYGLEKGYILIIKIIHGLDFDIYEYNFNKDLFDTQKEIANYFIDLFNSIEDETLLLKSKEDIQKYLNSKDLSKILQRQSVYEFNIDTDKPLIELLVRLYVLKQLSSEYNNMYDKEKEELRKLIINNNNLIYKSDNDEFLILTNKIFEKDNFNTKKLKEHRKDIYLQYLEKLNYQRIDIKDKEFNRLISNEANIKKLYDYYLNEYKK